MGLLNKIDETLATVRHCQNLAERYKARRAQELADGRIVADRSADDNGPAYAA